MSLRQYYNGLGTFSGSEHAVTLAQCFGRVACAGCRDHLVDCEFSCIADDVVNMGLRYLDLAHGIDRQFLKFIA